MNLENTCLQFLCPWAFRVISETHVMVRQRSNISYLEAKLKGCGISGVTISSY